MSEPTTAAGPRALSADDQLRVNRWTILAGVVRGTVHSVNNILQSIGGQAELLAAQAEAPDEVQRRAAKIAAHTGRAAGFVRELSATAREATGAPDRADLRQAVARAVALREYDLMRARVALDVQAGADAIPLVAIDEFSLSTVLLNLLLNAEQALAGVPDARIVVGLECPAGRAVVSVRDNGPGVPADLREAIFEPFVSTGRPGATLGLGLAVSRRLAEEHGGRLALAGDGAPGARFELELPIATR